MYNPVIADLAGSAQGALLPVRACYRPDDPYAVELTFNPGTDNETTWTFARDLLVTGCQRPVGELDIAVEPTVSGVQVTLGATWDTALPVVFTTNGIRQFLEASMVSVPAGRESDFCNIDLELALLTLED